jgi:hypothetical protein
VVLAAEVVPLRRLAATVLTAVEVAAPARTVASWRRKAAAR